MQKPKYKRIMLKISGEALAGEKKLGLDTDTINEISRNIKEVYDLGVEIAIVVGVGISGEVEAGKEWTEPRRIIWACWHSYQCIGLQDALESQGMPTRVQTAIEMRQIAEPYIRRKAVRHLEKKRIVIFACGTGNPFFQRILRLLCVPLRLTRKSYCLPKRLTACMTVTRI